MFAVLGVMVPSLYQIIIIKDIGLGTLLDVMLFVFLQ